MDVRRTLRPVMALLVMAAVPCFSVAQARRSSYDPASQNSSSKPKDSFIDFTLKGINPSDKDYGQCIDDARKMLLTETIESGYFWSNVVALGLLGCLFIMIMYQRRVEIRRECITAAMLGQYEHALARANSQVDDATKRNHCLMEALDVMKEAALRRQPVDAGILDHVAPATSSRTSTTQKRHTAEPKNGHPKAALDGSTVAAMVAEAGAQIGLFKPEVDLVTKINALQQQLSRSEEREKELRRQLNEAGRKLQSEQERNRSLKGE